MKHLLLITIATVLVVGCSSYKNTDIVKVISEKASPNGQLIASSFSCSGGGAVGYFNFNANLRRMEEKLDQRDCLLGKHKTWKAFNDIEVRWIDDSNLETSYKQDNSSSYRENNLVKVASKYDVNIHYLVTNLDKTGEELKAEGK